MFLSNMLFAMCYSTCLGEGKALCKKYSVKQIKKAIAVTIEKGSWSMDLFWC